MDPRFPGNLDFQKSKKLVWLRAVLANFGFVNVDFWLCAVLACAESDFAQANTAQSGILSKFLRENKLLSKTILAWLSGAQMASF